MADDTMLREMTSDPKFRKILVTDGKTEVGQALVKALVEGRRRDRLGRPRRAVEEAARPRRHRRAGAGDAGAARPHRRPLGAPSWPARSAARSTSSSTTPRSIAPSASRRAAAPTRRKRRDGHQLLRPAAPGPGVRPGAEGALGRRHDARRGVGQPALGLRALELPAARHLLGVEGGGALARPVPARGDAGDAASASSTSSRARSTTSGTRTCRRRRSRPAALASAIVKALKEGIEDVYPGDVAQEWLERWRENPKVLERELAAAARRRRLAGRPPAIRPTAPETT